MSEPVLTRKQQRKSLSSMKAKKKVVKNILATPDSLKLSKQTVNERDVFTLLNTLDSLLSEARLPNSKGIKEASSAPSTDNKVDVSHARMKRSRLLIGVNATSKGIKSETAACLLLADDIQPQLFIMHLLLMCKVKKIPYIFVPNFRQFTKKTLGFSCIVLGFKKDFQDFSPAIHCIKSIWVKLGNTIHNQEQDNDNLVGESTNSFDKSEKKKCTPPEKEGKKMPFNYLYTNSNQVRAFIPEGNKRTNKSDDQSFILVENLKECDMYERVSDEHPKNVSISDVDVSISDGEKSNFKKVKLIKKKLQFDSKRNIHIDKRFKNCSNVSYFTSEIIRMESNPNREKKKVKNFKKVFDS